MMPPTHSRRNHRRVPAFACKFGVVKQQVEQALSGWESPARNEACTRNQSSGRPACLLACQKGDRYKDESAVAPRVTVMSNRKRVDEEIEKIKKGNLCAGRLVNHA